MHPLPISRAARLARRAAGAVAGLLLASAALAQASYPAKPIRVVVPAVVGSAADIVARLLGERVSAAGTQPWVIDNKPGAGGTIGADVVAKAAPDGYTLLFTANNFIISPKLYPSVPYDIQRDFTPVGPVAIGQDMIFVNPSLNVKTIAELVELARRTPDGINYGAPFVGASAHLMMETFARISGAKLVYIPASGGPQSFTEAVAGRVPVVIGSSFAGLGFVRNGQLRALALVDNQRSALLPDVPTLKEAGYPGVNLPLWFGLYAPARLPPGLVAQINKDVVTVLASPDFAQALAARGFVAKPGSPADLQAAMREGEPVFAKAIVDGNIKP